MFRSLNHIYAQVIDDAAGRTLVAVDSRAPDFRQQAKARRQRGGGQDRGRAAGRSGPRRSGIGQVVFDRGGYQYHGRVKALAEAARAAGLGF